MSEAGRSKREPSARVPLIEQAIPFLALAIRLGRQRVEQFERDQPIADPLFLGIRITARALGADDRLPKFRGVRSSFGEKQQMSR
jgi:hypothetical protein